MGKEKEEVLLNTDIFIQTSRHEGMPLGILEALSYGIPCLATEGTNLGTIIENNNAGWYANNSIESIANKIEETIKDKQKLRKKGKNAIKLIKNDFSWSIISQKTTSIYKQKINKG